MTTPSPAGDPATTDTLPRVNDLARPATWSNAVPLPLTYFGMRPMLAPLDDPFPELVNAAAAHGLTQRHTHHCRTCHLLRAIHLLCYTTRWRLAMIIGLPAAFYTPTALLGTPAPPLQFFLYGWITSAALVHLLILTGIVIFCRHRRQMREELALRTITANIHLQRPHPAARA